MHERLLIRKPQAVRQALLLLEGDQPRDRRAGLGVAFEAASPRQSALTLSDWPPPYDWYPVVGELSRARHRLNPSVRRIGPKPHKERMGTAQPERKVNGALPVDSWVM